MHPRTLVPLVVLVCAAGCLARFRPTVPLRAQSGDLELTMKEVRVGGVQDVVLESRSPGPHAIHRGRLTVATRAPCTGGEEAASIVVDESPVPSGALPAGTHEIRARFEHSADDFGLDLVLDLELEDGACARTPVISQSIPLATPARFVVIGSFDLAGTDELSGLRGIYGGKIGGGGWVGRLLLTAEAGVGGSSCTPNICGRDEEGSLRSGFAVPLAADVRYVVSAVSRNRLLGVFMLGARYALAPISLPTLTEGDRKFVTHGGYGVVSFGMGDAVKGPFRGIERAPQMEGLLMIGVLAAPGAPGGGAAISGGFGFRFILPL